MDRKIVVSVLALTLIALALAISLPGGRKVDDEPRLPWLVSVNADGYSSVFGLTLGASRLADARAVFEEQGVSNLFLSADDELSVETYFQSLYLSGIRADMVLTLELERPTLQRYFDRGARISKLESGAKKVNLAGEDEAALADARIGHITYIPGTDLSEELILSRFGEPARRLAESSGIVHWLYPDIGLDIAVNPDGKEVLQYVQPGRFGELLKPLQSGTGE
ncbi:MAG: hypothetical protein KDI68_13020 [Gammaproteobacteria bacterium]|nr:hypothetical protein [Gammaproteobacteria bacterium]